MRHKRAFTLIELVMSVVIGGIIIYPMLTIFFNTSSKNPTADYLNMAVHLADSKMETVSNQRFDSIASQGVTAFSGDFSDFNSEVIVHYVDAGALETSVDPTQTAYKWIKVKITSNNLPASAVELSTLVTDLSNKY